MDYHFEKKIEKRYSHTFIDIEYHHRCNEINLTTKVKYEIY